MSGTTGAAVGGFVGGVVVSALVVVGGLYLFDYDVVPENQPEPSTAPTTEPTPAPTSGAPPPPMVNDFGTVFTDVHDGVVRIEQTTCSGNSMGSGALIEPDLVLTAAHVVEDSVTLKIISGFQISSGEIVGLAPENDVALVRVSEALDGHVFEVAEQQAPQGTDVAALGYPRSGPLSITRGVISAYGEEAIYADDDGAVTEIDGLLRMTTDTNVGNSGGPVIGLDGTIHGIVSGGALTTGVVDETGQVVVDVPEGWNYAVAADTIRDRLADWQQNPEPQPPASCDDQPEPGTVNLVTAVTAGPETEAVSAVLFDYFDGVNRSEYERAYLQLSEGRRDAQTLEDFTEAYSSSVVSDVVILDVVPDGDDLLVDLTFTSYQSPEHGPEGMTCTIWAPSYRFVRGGPHGWLLDVAEDDGDRPVYQACS